MIVPLLGDCGIECHLSLAWDAGRHTAKLLLGSRAKIVAGKPSRVGQRGEDDGGGGGHWGRFEGKRGAVFFFDLSRLLLSQHC